MSDSPSNKILATVEAKDFIGRTRETEMLLRCANGEAKSLGLLLLSAPAAGATELLKQIYDQLFSGQSQMIPFYFAVRKSDKTAKSCAVRFLHTFIAQTVAFRHQEPKIFDAAPDIAELAELAAPDDAHWIERLTIAARRQPSSELNTDLAFVKSCLSAPLRAAAHGANSFVMIDNLHKAESFSGDVDFVEELKEVFSRSTIAFVLAGRRRFLLDAAQTGNTKLTGAEHLRIETLGFTEAGLLAENLAEKYAVRINEQSRDLIARQFDGNPTFINFLLQAASEKKLDLDSFQKVEQIYTDELFGGRIGVFYDSVFREISPDVETQKNIVRLLTDAPAAEYETRRRPLDGVFKNWRDDAVSTREDFQRLMSLLNTNEIVRLSSNTIEAMSENDVLNDYLKARLRLEIMAENRALVVAEMLSDFLKRAPQTMAKFYRQNSAIGLRAILAAFNCQETPAALLDYSVFKDKYKNAAENEIADGGDEIKKIRLPQIVYTAHTAAFYPPISQVTDETRSAVAVGFQERAYTDADEVVWIAAEIDSKLEASSEMAEFWCDRLEMVALVCNFIKYKIWLVAPEGFAPEAMEILRQRNAHGSSRRQAALLAEFLQAETIGDAEKSAANEYEITVPMGGDTELIAAGAIEEIARRHAFEPKAINQIKTALIEACINAAEHSLSPDRKIYQKFTVDADKIIITISNRGLRLTDKKTGEINPVEGRRGWGFKLMKSLMDEVKFEQVDDGTRILMTKYLTPLVKEQ